MRLKYRVSLAVISILMVMTLFLSSSYSLWKITVTQGGENVISAGCFDVKLENVDNNNNINLTNTYPMTDEKGKNLTPYIFKITNNCTIDASYTIYLNQLDSQNKVTNGDQKIEDYIKYTFKEQNGAGTTDETAKKLKDGTAVTTDDLNTADITFNYGDGKNIQKTYALGTGVVTGRTGDTGAGGSKTYELHLWIGNEANKTIGGQTFEAGVSVVAYATDASKLPESTASTSEVGTD